MRSAVVHTFTGFTNKRLGGLDSGLLGVDYTTNQMSYDLRRLRLHGLIERIPGTITYRLTTDGIKTVEFADQPPAPIELRHALAQIDRSITGYIDDARLATTA